jgi:leucyl aminopeptidase
LVTDDPSTEAAWAHALPALTGTFFARDLVTEPSDTLTPEGFVARLAEIVAAGAELRVLRHGDPDFAKMGGLRAVGAGSVHPPCVAMLSWAGTLDQAPLVLCGKGITFDTGGLCVKPADGMWDMRADMAGAAACAGAILTRVLRRSPQPVIALLALAENALAGAAYRPSDVLTMFDDSTVEVVDTDAEGRLVLADALAFAQTFKPKAIIDIATLTGSIVSALGHEHAGLFGNDPALGDRLRQAGAPIDASHRKVLESDIADLRHCSPERMQPDASQAAAFLSAFVGEVPWAHLDIGGTENVAEATDLAPQGATGFGVRLFDRLLDQLV